MPIQEDVARIALALPGATQVDGEFAFRANGRQFVHVWRERVDPKNEGPQRRCGRRERA